MGKSKKKTDKGTALKEESVLATAASAAALTDSEAGISDAVTAQDIKTVPGPVSPATEGTPSSAAPLAVPPPQKSRWRRLLPDLIKVVLALAVIATAGAIWYKPPLFLSSRPYVSYTFGGQKATDAKLYRPLAMPTRYYIELPRQLANRYTWFAVDRRREVAALSEEPGHSFLGQKAIKRSDPLGLDLEFRKLDNSEWQVHFFEDSVVFSNAVLTVRIDTKLDNNNGGK